MIKSIEYLYEEFPIKLVDDGWPVDAAFIGNDMWVLCKFKNGEHSAWVLVDEGEAVLVMRPDIDGAPSIGKSILELGLAGKQLKKDVNQFAYDWMKERLV